MLKFGFNKNKISENNLVDLNDLKAKNNSTNTAEIAKHIVQKVCNECIEEYHRIKSRLEEEIE